MSKRRVRENPVEQEKERRVMQQNADEMKADEQAAGRAVVAGLLAKKSLAEAQAADKAEKEAGALGQMATMQSKLRGSKGQKPKQ